MDPQAVLIELLESLHNGDSEQAVESARTLADWIDRDGFLPVVDCLASKGRAFYYAEREGAEL